MSEFTLNIAFTLEQLDTLFAAGTQVVVSKQASDGLVQVPWQVFQPFEANSMTWKEEYGIYAANSVTTHGAKIEMLSTVPVGATMNGLYKLQDTGAFSDPVSGGIPKSFSVLNEYSNAPYMTIGLFQDAHVNGTDVLGNAVSAAPVLLRNTAEMTPSATVLVGLQSQIITDSIKTVVTSPLTTLTFGGAVQSRSVTYDSALSKFLPVAD